MNVGEVMTLDVVAVTPDTTVRDAAALMLKEHISGLPVINDAHALVGIVTEGDFLRRAEIGTQKARPRWLEFLLGPAALAAEYVHTHSRKVADVMTRSVVVANEDMALDEAVSLMEKNRIKRLPVVRSGRVVGMISRANLLRAIVAIPRFPDVSQDDKDLRDKVTKELSKHAWNARDGQIFVKDGIVSIWGFVTSDRQRTAMRVLAENISGVKSVRDHSTLYEPMSDIVLGQAPGDDAPEPPPRTGA